MVHFKQLIRFQFILSHLGFTFINKYACKNEVCNICDKTLENKFIVKTYCDCKFHWSCLGEQISMKQTKCPDCKCDFTKIPTKKFNKLEHTTNTVKISTNTNGTDNNTCTALIPIENVNTKYF